MELIRKIKKYTVSIQLYEAKKAEIYSIVKLNKHKEIKVIECGYDDEFGYYKKNDNTPSNNNIF